MSQHWFHARHNERPISILAGWDRTLQGFFLTIDYSDVSEDAEPEYVYNNLDDPELARYFGYAPTFDYFADKLDKLGIELPTGMIVDINHDAETNAGNKIVHWPSE